MIKKTLPQKINELRGKEVTDLKGLLLSRRNSRENEIEEIIESYTEGIVKVEKTDSFDVKVKTGNYSRTFLLMDESELEGDVNPNDIRGLAEYLVNAVLCEYSKEVIKDMRQD